MNTTKTEWRNDKSSDTRNSLFEFIIIIIIIILWFKFLFFVNRIVYLVSIIRNYFSNKNKKINHRFFTATSISKNYIHYFFGSFFFIFIQFCLNLFNHVDHFISFFSHYQFCLSLSLS